MSISYKYNTDGLRTQKTVANGDTTTTYNYTWVDSNLTHQTWGNKYLHFYYDNSGSILGFTYFNGTSTADYTYVKNMQGDVIGILDSTGATVATYTYDAWGNILTATGDLANINPIRYRGYYYDEEIDMYYIQSRYYDQNVGRFINADEASFIGFLSTSNNINAFKYCNNNPILYTDESGYIAGVDDAIAIAVFIGYCVVLLGIVVWMSLSDFLESWTSFCNSLGNGLASIGKAIWNGGKAAWDWSVKKVKAATAAIAAFITVARADAEIKSKVKRNSKTRYWTATLKSNYVDIGRAISYSTAVKEVSNGRNVFTVTKSEAKAVAKAAYRNKKPVGPEIDKGKENVIGYYYHFHVNGRKNKGHVFFLFG